MQEFKRNPLIGRAAYRLTPRSRPLEDTRYPAQKAAPESARSIRVIEHRVQRDNVSVLPYPLDKSEGGNDPIVAGNV